MVGLIALGAMVPGFGAAPLRINGSNLVIVLAVVTLAVIAYVNQAVLGDRVFLSGLGALAMILLVFAGPLPALLLEAAEELVDRALGNRRRPLAHAANLASTGWGLLAATAILSRLGHPAGSPSPAVGELLAVAVAGAVFFILNYAIVRTLVGVVADGLRFLQLFRREFVPALPAQLAIVVFAALSATLSALLGVAGLLPIIVAIIAPESALAVLKLMARPANDLSRAQARTLYAAALADANHLSPGSRRQLAVMQASGGLQRWGATLRLEAALRTHPLRDADGPTMMPLLLATTERWDGYGWPGALSRERIPIEARIARIADRWAELTCADGPQLTQPEALARLGLLAGSELDPALVDSVREVLATEPRLGSAPSPAPVLHRLPRPRAVPRAQLARLVTAIR